MSIMEIFFKKLQQAKEERTLADLARKANIMPSGLTRALQGKQMLGLDKASAVIEIWGGELIFPDEKALLAFNLEEFSFFPKISSQLAANGSFVVEQEQEKTQPFQKDWLKARQICNIKDAILLSVTNDFMHPIIASGDTVLIALKQKKIASGNLYAIRIGTEIQIRRLEQLASGGIRIHCENKNFYPPQEIQSCEKLEIIGRVHWIGKTV